jgi:hypothetical protein
MTLSDIYKHNKELLNNTQNQGYKRCITYAISKNDKLFMIISYKNISIEHFTSMKSSFSVSSKLFSDSIDDYEKYHIECGLLHLALQNQLYDNNVESEEEDLRILLTPILLKF